MSFPLTSTIHFIIVLSLLSSVHSQFSESKNCVFTSPEGYTFDLTQMRKSSYDYRYDYFKYTYKANFCGQLVSTCNMSDAPSALFLRRGICVGKFSKFWSGVKAAYLDKDIKTNGVKLAFQTGERCVNSYNSEYSVNYTIKCDPNSYGSGKLETVRKLGTCSYDFVFSSKYGCPLASSSAGSASVSILFYLSLIFSTYLVIFTYKNYKENPEDGVVKALPHREYWREFFEYAVIGYHFSHDFAKEKINYYYERYKERQAGVTDY